MDYTNIFDTVKNVNFRGVVYANGQWVLTGIGNDEAGNFDNTFHVCVTSDLKNFTDKVIHTIPYNDNYYHTYKIAYGNGVFVMGTWATSGNIVYASSDLNSFKRANLSQLWLKNLKFLNGQFIAVTWEKWTRGGQFLRWEGHVLTSKDGINWNNQATFNDAGLNDVTYYNGYYYVVGTDGYCARSTNLKNWSKCNTGIRKEIRNITSGATGIVATADNKIVLFSSNGTSWQKVFTDNDMEPSNVEYGNGIYMIMMSNPSGVAYSKNGINWEWIYRNTSGYQYGMAFSQEKQMFLISGNRWAKDDTGSIKTISISREVPSSTDGEVLYIYDLGFSFLETIDSFKSLRWRRKYFEAGEFEIVLHPDSKLLESLKENNLIIRNNYTEAGIIETIQFSDNGTDEDVTIKGRFLSSILDRRIVKSTINFTGRSVDGMKALLNQMTPFPKFEIEQTTFDSEPITFQCSYKNVYDYEVKLSKYSNVGFRVVPNLENKVFIFENYRGLDRTDKQNINERYSFSDDEFNIDNATLTHSNANKVNYALVGGQGEGTNRVLVEVKKDNSTGFDLYERFVDSKNQSNQNLSGDAYKQVLIQDGNNALADATNEFKFDAYDNDYKDKYDLGDVVDVYKSNWNYKTQERITEIEEVIEDGKKSVSIVTGTPLPEIFSED